MRISLGSIKEELNQDNWQVLSTEYKNLDTEMTFLCPEGHRVYTSWKKLRTKRECPTCKMNGLAQQDGEIIPKPVGAYRILALD